MGPQASVRLPKGKRANTTQIYPLPWSITATSNGIHEHSRKGSELPGALKRKAFPSLDLAFMFSVLLLVYFIESVAFYPFLVFAFIELLTLLVSVLHARRPSLGVLLIYISLEIGKALAAITLGLVTVLYDHDKDCAVTKCKTFNFSPVERFRFFWFLISKAAFSMFLCLVAMAAEPRAEGGFRRMHSRERTWKLILFVGVLLHPLLEQDRRCALYTIVRADVETRHYHLSSAHKLPKISGSKTGFLAVLYGITYTVVLRSSWEFSSHGNLRYDSEVGRCL
ncbi:hypothetical protein Y032_0011g1494 [Ancylostoma ceylanicum]|uniref:Uncharacterized protein n=1 Tax=Ancylostoma ceylanicum TaxID=53326 RepID=A0A016VEZ3_9BILA|nr:hypothetical protein Y032_0011g1494 [Ancylostoma ceylanicum]